MITVREAEILELMALGASNKEIATKLFISCLTVRTHSSNIFYKLNVRNRTQAVIYYFGGSIEFARRDN